MKGIDNPAYYRVVEDDQRYYMDYTGTGNSLNVRHPHSLQLIMDSLRYWVTEMHVDGFRFDLASTLAREFYDVDRLATFFELVQQDPVVSQVKLIAEPWDIGPGGYQVGGFPPQWSEWNGAYRDTVRDFWRGEPVAGRVRLPGGRLVRPLRAHRAPPVRQHQLRDRPRRLHAARPRLLQREAQRGQRRGQQRRREPQPLLEPRCRGPDRRPGDPRRSVARAAQPPGHPAAQPGRADDPARRRAGPHPARQQQHLRPGLRDQLGALGRRRPRRCSSSPRALVRLRQDHPTFRRKRFFTGTTVRTGPTGEERLNDIVWLHPTGRPMEEGDWCGRLPGHRHVPQRRRHRRQGQPWARPSTTTTSCSTSTPTARST